LNRGSSSTASDFTAVTTMNSLRSMVWAPVMDYGTIPIATV
jgi:hypothetical protein